MPKNTTQTYDKYEKNVPYAYNITSDSFFIMSFKEYFQVCDLLFEAIGELLPVVIWKY